MRLWLVAVEQNKKKQVLGPPARRRRAHQKPVVVLTINLIRRANRRIASDGRGYRTRFPSCHSGFGYAGSVNL